MVDWLVEAEEEDSRRGQEFSQVQIFQYVIVKSNQIPVQYTRTQQCCEADIFGRLQFLDPKPDLIVTFIILKLIRVGYTVLLKTCPR